MKKSWLVVFSSVLFSCSIQIETRDLTSENLSDKIRLILPGVSQKKLQKNRDAAIERGHILKTEKQYVPAELLVGNESASVKIRLKGDEIDHLQGEKWSFRVKSKSSLVGNHKRFSLQNPSTKNYLWEYIFHAFCKKEGILALDYFFLPLYINAGESKVYAYEAVADNKTLSQFGRKEGPILKFDENAYWEKFVSTTDKIDSVCMLTANIKSCNKKWSRKHKKEYDEAETLLMAYRSGELPPEQVFDYNLLAKYVAISEVLGSSHNLRWINLRWYYNLETKKLEPIAFDCFDGDHPRTTVIWYKERKKFEYFLHPLFADQGFIELVEQHLKNYAQIEYLKELLHENHTALSGYNQLLKKEDPSYFFNRAALFTRADLIQKELTK